MALLAMIAAVTRAADADYLSTASVCVTHNTLDQSALYINAQTMAFLAPMAPVYVIVDLWVQSVIALKQTRLQFHPFLLFVLVLPNNVPVQESSIIPNIQEEKHFHPAL